ncbi:hypothetical protein IL306_007067, partial [Fusarium sp. DS 682]
RDSANHDENLNEGCEGDEDEPSDCGDEDDEEDDHGIDEECFKEYNRLETETHSNGNKEHYGAPVKSGRITTKNFGVIRYGRAEIVANGSQISNPWTGPGTSNATPFDRPFYLIIALAVGGTSSWFPDDVHGKPWVNDAITPKTDFWNARDKWYPTWEKNDGGEMVIKRVSMWQQCDRAATDLSQFSSS